MHYAGQETTKINSGLHLYPFFEFSVFTLAAQRILRIGEVIKTRKEGRY